jgi:hypothetical protein
MTKHIFGCVLMAGSINAFGQITFEEMLRHPLVPAVREILRKENPIIERVAIMEVKSHSAKGPHVVIGWGIRPDSRFSGSFRDELFGIFLADTELTKIDRVLELIPSPRWGDYEFHVERITHEQVTIVGKGSTYGNGPIRRMYRLER